MRISAFTDTNSGDTSSNQRLGSARIRSGIGRYSAREASCDWRSNPRNLSADDARANAGPKYAMRETRIVLAKPATRKANPRLPVSAAVRNKGANVSGELTDTAPAAAPSVTPAISLYSERGVRRG